jgi:YD repeat-containing protein
MTACGFDIGDTPGDVFDQFHFAYVEVPSEETTIIARVDSITNTNGWAKGGVMIRDTFADDSKHAMVAVTPENGVVFLYRENTADVTSVTNVDGITAPQWVKLQRDPNGNCTAFYSPNGVSYTQIGSLQHISMDTPIYVGLALTSCNGDEICQATFSNLTIDGNAPSSWSNKDIGIDCNEIVGSGCQEIFSTSGFKKVSDTGYITYEPGVYDTLIKNGDGTWSLEIKNDKTTQHFDPNGRLTRIIDRNGNVLTFGYDVSGKLVTITDAAGRVTLLSYGPNNKVIRVTDPIGRTAAYSYDANDNLISTTDMAGC